MLPVTLATASHDDLDGLVTLLRACVADGASVGWVATPSPADARAFWRGCLAEQGAGRRRVVVARDGDRVVGTGQLIPAPLPNGRHRAEIAKLLVAPQARRRGIARAVMTALEDAARDDGRRLLILDTASAAAARLYEVTGWTRLGDVPGYALDTRGVAEPTTIFFKQLRDA
ncbi:MAG: GNAT family N-acetyltransferase [Kofleriaceae bacterium]|nr:GNAT family N-acetyltransferase [Kofleriaceae bacterium]MCB9573327.1 GNAT family N-acetyltransferase [Kofleriaceae bacterium]